MANIRPPTRPRFKLHSLHKTCCHLSRTATGDSDNENSIAMLTPTERIKTEQREKKELRQIFKHLLSLDIVAMSFINFIASARRTSAMNFLTPIRILC